MNPVFDLSLPEPLKPLAELSLDLLWSWNHAADQLWEKINSDVWVATQNPISVLQLTTADALQKLSQDANFLIMLDQVIAARAAYLQADTWFSQQSQAFSLNGVAYFSMEFGLCESLPLYAGGLGVLAGDYLKTASDLGVPLIGVGLLYQQGYFHQTFSSEGYQQQIYLQNDFSSLPISRLLKDDGSWWCIDIDLLARRVRFHVWKVQVGRTILYLLDSSDTSNQPIDKGITSRLYGDGSEMRLVQEMALGICGWRLVESLGLSTSICHLNEGHAAFATLERIRQYCLRHGVSFQEGLWATRIGNVFTTHTPVAAGFDCYPPHLLSHYIAGFCQQLGVDVGVIMNLGRANPADTHEAFNMAYLALRTCAHSNGVSKLHGQVSRRIFQPLFPRWPERDVPVSHITNGVHIPTWDSQWADSVWTHLFGKERWRGGLDMHQSVSMQALSDLQLWRMTINNRADLVDYVRNRIACSANTHEAAVQLDPNILTIGFARRFTEYKRGDLLLRDPERLARILNHPERPVQLLVAGKAHPADEEGKRILQRWYEFVRRPDVHKHVVLLEDYDLAFAQHLVQGVNLWINTPRPPWEACGTSGMKVLVNGGLNLSTLDGWWAEAYSSSVGWAIGDGLEHDRENDIHDAEQLYQLLENDIIPLFYKRNSQGLPEKWLALMRASMQELTPRFSSNRMLQEYLTGLYQPAATGLFERTTQQGAGVKSLVAWNTQLCRHWHEVHIGSTELFVQADHKQARVVVYLGGIDPNCIKVQMIADAEGELPAHCLDMTQISGVECAIHAYSFQCALPNERSQNDFTVRVIAHHPLAKIPEENTLIVWQLRG
jgi:glycogen phosphorylase